MEHLLLDNLHLRLFTARCLTLPAGYWNMQRLQSSFWRFYQNDRDGAWIELPDSTLPLAAGRLYFVPAHVAFDSRNREEVRQFYVHFDVLGLPGIAMRELFTTPILLPPAPALEAAAHHLAAEAQDELTLDLAMQCRLKSLLYEGLARYLQTVPPETSERCSRLTTALAPVLPAIQCIENALSERLSNARLASLCHLSEDYFLRRFRTCVGQSPAQYILERRVTIAAQRLLFTDATIEKIADQTGFANRYYFTRIFTRQTGLAPAAFRKQGHI